MLITVVMAGWIGGIACAAGADSAADEDEDLLPIHEVTPLKPGDVRQLKNCAEFPFTDPWRGPWESLASKRLADSSPAKHQTSDRVISVGEGVTLSAQMQYDGGPLSGEWVRMYLGDCTGWTQIGVRKTDERGAVRHRLDQRLQVGVYAVVFQSVGDATTVRGQVWVLPRSAEVVAFELEGAALDNWGLQDLRAVSGAPTLARWHASQGRIVVYIKGPGQGGDGAETGSELSQWRTMLRRTGFVVGPIITIDGASTHSVSDDALMGASQWGRASNTPAPSPPLSTPVSTLYTTRSGLAHRFESQQMPVESIVYRERYCREQPETQGHTGWTELIYQLTTSVDGQR